MFLQEKLPTKVQKINSRIYFCLLLPVVVVVVCVTMVNHGAVNLLEFVAYVKSFNLTFLGALRRASLAPLALIEWQRVCTTQ